MDNREALLREAYAALNRNDLEGFCGLFSPDVVRVEPPGTPGSDTFRGLDAFKEHVIAQRVRWAEGGCDPQRIVVSGDRLVAFVHVRVRLKEQTEWLEGDVADAFEFRDGKVVHFCTYLDSRLALEWAGVQVPTAN